MHACCCCHCRRQPLLPTSLLRQQANGTQGSGSLNLGARLTRCQAHHHASTMFGESRRGRVISWSPEKPENDKKALLASHPDLTVRFVKEASITKRELVADKDFMDVGPRQENLTTIAGFPIMLQGPLQPCYGLTTGHGQKFASENGLTMRFTCEFLSVTRIHKTQATVHPKSSQPNCSPPDV